MRVIPRTRIRVLRVQERKALSLYLSLDTPIAGGPRAVSGHTGREKRARFAQKVQKNKAKKCFAVNKSFREWDKTKPTETAL